MEKFPGSIKNKFKLNQKGQFAIEAVLLTVLLVGCFLAITKFARDKKFLQFFVAPAAVKMKTMTGFGTWKPDGCIAPGKSKQTIGKCHPNSISRSLSSAPGN